MATATTTLKLPKELKVRIRRLAKQTGRSPHNLMLQALERIAFGRTGYLALYRFRPGRDEVSILAIRVQRELDYPV